MKKLFSIFFLYILPLFGEIGVFFTPSKKTYDILTNLFKNAEKSVYIATFSFSPDLLKNLENKNIDVKIVCEYGKTNKFLIKNHIEKGLFHSKFIIIDEKIAIITSANLTKDSFFTNHNNLLLIDDKKVVKYLMKKFDSFWNNYRYTEIFKEGNIEIWFSPENDCERLIKKEIRNAKNLINFSTYLFSNRSIANELIIKKKTGVEIYGIIEKQNLYHSVFYLLESYGCILKKSNMAGLVHDKFFLIDREKVLTGSFNPSLSAYYNVELLCLIKDKKVSEKFYNEWKKLWLFKSIKSEI